MKKVELLAPAGNYEALTGALMAGADAVYLGGNAFGARAYADNFSKEEICEGIRYAHILGKKIYLTVNTLVKEREFPSLYDFLLPFYENGLDGVIIQDMGVFTFIREYFPGLELHASTQMTITGAYGASLLKKEGACRIVPARELSLKEIKEIKNKVDIEIETFVHGAMCYCYSGQCLFSSILGGRSGNRGRCAQPCRLPYRVNGGPEEYPLSMKDMCTIELLPELIEAGIDSFKIEGRMKKPEYAAGVTAFYRKYIDRYYKCKEEGKKDTYHVEVHDLEQLNALYIRSERSEGYYHQHNGRNMITLSSPSYSGNDDVLIDRIRSRFLSKKKILPVTLNAAFHAGSNARLTITANGASVDIEGGMVQKALKQPLSIEKIKEQLSKSGGTNFAVSSVEISADDDIFMPVSSLNELRREGLHSLEEELIRNNGFGYSGRKALPYRKSPCVCDNNKNESEIHALVSTSLQLQAAVEEEISRIYIDKMELDEEFLQKLASYKERSRIQFYLVFPYIVRKRNEQHLNRLYQILNTPVFDGALVRNLETIAFLESKGIHKPVIADSSMYVWNSYACRFMMEKAAELYAPSELNSYELQDVQKTDDGNRSIYSIVIYGRIPMMISAGCLKKTEGECRMISGFSELSDRYQKQFPVYNDCTSCYNIIYNSVPLSLHKIFDQDVFRPVNCRLDFTTENQEETRKIISYFRELSSGRNTDPFYKEFTTGHYKRGVE
ncbi:MAG: U32 family peptidase [Suilimivivens sp.]